LSLYYIDDVVYSASLLTTYIDQLQWPTTMANYNDKLQWPTTFTNYNDKLHSPTTITNDIYNSIVSLIIRYPTHFPTTEKIHKKPILWDITPLTIFICIVYGILPFRCRGTQSRCILL